jgi:hypothetical protein
MSGTEPVYEPSENQMELQSELPVISTYVTLIAHPQNHPLHCGICIELNLWRFE